MYLSKAIALGIIATLPLALGFPFLKRFPFLETRQNGVTCQTSSGSPLTDDVTAAINQLSGKPGNCPQTNGHASGETKITPSLRLLCILSENC